MHMKNRKKVHNERGITFFHETERYVNNLNIYNRSKNGSKSTENAPKTGLTIVGTNYRGWLILHCSRVKLISRLSLAVG